MSEYDALLAEIKEITGYQSVTDVSKQHPPLCLGRAVVWIEVKATVESFVIVSKDTGEPTGTPVLDGALTALIRMRPKDFAEWTAAQLADTFIYEVLARAKIELMGNWGPG